MFPERWTSQQRWSRIVVIMVPTESHTLRKSLPLTQKSLTLGLAMFFFFGLWEKRKYTGLALTCCSYEPCFCLQMKAGLLETHHLPNPGQQPAPYPDTCLKPSKSNQLPADPPGADCSHGSKPSQKQEQNCSPEPIPESQANNSSCFIPPSFGEVCYEKTDTNGEVIGMVVKENSFFF